MIALIASREKLSMLPKELRTGSMDILDKAGHIREIAEQLRNAQHYTRILIDVDFFYNDTEKDILDGIYLLQMMSNAQLLVFAQGREQGDPLLSKLIGMGLYNFVTAIDPVNIERQIAECIQGRERFQAEQFLSIEPSKKRVGFSGLKKLFTGKKKQLVQIGIAGVLPRIGVTTQALRIVRYLTSLGNRVCYVEANSSGHLELIQTVYSNVDSDTTSICYSGITMYRDPAKADPAQYDCMVIDYGASPANLSLLGSEISVCVAGSTAWEMAALAEAMANCPGESDKRRFLFSFTGREEEADLLDFMALRWKNTYFAGYCPDMFQPLRPEEKELYRALLDSERGDFSKESKYPK